MTEQTIKFFEEQLDELRYDLTVVTNDKVKDYIKERIELFEEALKVARFFN